MWRQGPRPAAGSPTTHRPQGRSGKAISLVEPEELPFLMDLQLYLGRTLNAIPADRKRGGADDEPDGYTDPQEIVLASFPASRLESEVEFINTQIAASHELGELLGVATRALQVATAAPCNGHVTAM